MLDLPPAPALSPTLVAKTDPSRREQFLLVTPAGEAIWTADPEQATSFVSMREAMRMAMRLPGGLRAFGLPRGPEPAARRAH